MRDIPRGIEVLIKKAAVDVAFRQRLLAERSEAAQAIGLTLTPAEAAMLDVASEQQLLASIEHTRVEPRLRPAFLGRAAAVMLAALGAGLSGCIPCCTLGAQPDMPYRPPPEVDSLAPKPGQQDVERHRPRAIAGLSIDHVQGVEPRDDPPEEPRDDR